MEKVSNGRSPTGRATLASHQALAGLGHAEGIPNAENETPLARINATLPTVQAEKPVHIYQADLKTGRIDKWS